jgi:hypothetical protein
MLSRRLKNLAWKQCHDYPLTLLRAALAPPTPSSRSACQGSSGTTSPLTSQCVPFQVVPLPTQGCCCSTRPEDAAVRSGVTGAQGTLSSPRATPPADA